MEFRDSPEVAEFRADVREFLDKELTDEFRQPDEAVLGVGVGENPNDEAWLKKLAGKGWVAPAWPKEYGGAGLSTAKQFVFNEELARAQALRPNFLGIGLIGPTIIVHGNEEQKKEHLSGLLSGDVYWCQGLASPSLAPTSHRCRRRPSRMATNSSSTARKYGRRAPIART